MFASGNQKKIRRAEATMGRIFYKYIITTDLFWGLTSQYDGHHSSNAIPVWPDAHMSPRYIHLMTTLTVHALRAAHGRGIQAQND